MAALLPPVCPSVLAASLSPGRLTRDFLLLASSEAAAADSSLLSTQEQSSLVGRRDFLRSSLQTHSTPLSNSLLSPLLSSPSSSLVVGLSELGEEEEEEEGEVGPRHGEKRLPRQR